VTLTLLRHIAFRSLTERETKSAEREAEREWEMQREGGRREIQGPQELIKANIGGETAQREGGWGVEGTGARSEGG